MDTKSLGHIAITRRPEHLGLGSFMNFKVFIDGKNMAVISYAKRVVIPIEPGSHKIHIKMEMSWSESEPILIQALEGTTIELNCGFRFHGWSWILNLILPAALDIKYGGFKLDNVVAPLKLPLFFLVPLILMPVSLFFMALSLLVLWLSEGLFKTLFGSYAATAQLLFILFIIGLFTGLIAVRFWKWFSKYW